MQDKKTKREQAEARGELRSQRSHKQQLAILDSRVGAGKGARRERSRLIARAFKDAGRKLAELSANGSVDKAIAVIRSLKASA